MCIIKMRIWDLKKITFFKNKGYKRIIKILDLYDIIECCKQND